jgi:hypothetical protein
MSVWIPCARSCLGWWLLLNPTHHEDKCHWRLDGELVDLREKLHKHHDDKRIQVTSIPGPAMASCPTKHS